MGNRFEITVVAEDRTWANERIDAAVSEIRRIERLLTTFNDDSDTSLVNRNAGIAAVQVDKEVFYLIQRSLKISQLTQGAFDITYGGIDKKLWNFDSKMTALPDAHQAQKSIRLDCDQAILVVVLKRETEWGAEEEKGSSNDIPA